TGSKRVTAVLCTRRDHSDETDSGNRCKQRPRRSPFVHHSRPHEESVVPVKRVGDNRKQRPTRYDLRSSRQTWRKDEKECDNSACRNWSLQQVHAQSSEVRGGVLQCLNRTVHVPARIAMESRVDQRAYQRAITKTQRTAEQVTVVGANGGDEWRDADDGTEHSCRQPPPRGAQIHQP